MLRSRRSRPHAGADHWDALGSTYAEGWTTPAQVQLSERELSFVEMHLRRTPARRVVDVGVGVGRVLRTITSSVHPNAEVYGVDASRVMLDAAENELRGHSPIAVHFVQADVGTGPPPVEVPVDFISAIRVLKYTSSWENSVAHLLQVLHSDGLLVFTVPNVRSINALWRPRFHYGRTTAAEVRRAVERLGASIEEIKVFSRLPDLLYERATSERLSRVVTAAEAAMNRALGDILLGKELFVAVRARR